MKLLDSILIVALMAFNMISMIEAGRLRLGARLKKN